MPAVAEGAPADVAGLLDWRRQVAVLYQDVRDLCREDPPAAHAQWLATREALYRDHPQSPVPAGRRAGFTLPSWPYDPGWALRAPLDTGVAPDRFQAPVRGPCRPGGELLHPADGGGRAVQTSGAGTIDFVLVGRLAVAGGTLDAYWLDAYGGGLFVPFRDATAGQETYGAGRYLLDTAKSADLGVDHDGALILDFNFAYHPSCAWDPAWACPLAPPGSRLDVAVRAGERLPT